MAGQASEAAAVKVHRRKPSGSLNKRQLRRPGSAGGSVGKNKPEGAAAREPRELAGSAAAAAALEAARPRAEAECAKRQR